MDFISILSNSAAPELTDLIGKFLRLIYDSLGGAGMLGWSVVLFTVIIRAIVLPLDLWQKIAMRKQQRAMQAMQPQLEKLQKQYADRPDLLRVEQAKLQKKSGVSLIGSCLPMIANMVIFIFVFAGFRAFISWQNEMNIYELANRYIEVTAAGGEWTLAASGFQLETFGWIQNVYMPDHWSAIIPTLDAYTGTGLGGIGAKMPINATALDGGYDTLMGVAIDRYNGEGARWNGFMILPILSIATSLVSGKLMQSQNKRKNNGGTSATQKKQASQAKMMMLMMPLISGIFSLLYSAAFALYMLASNLFTSAVGLIFNFTASGLEKRRAGRDTVQAKKL